MTDFEHILPLWSELEAAGADYVLATVVAVEGSSYRKPGARMLLAQDGRRAGTVSGGCLEAAVAKKAWWLTGDGPVVERYSTLDDDGDLPYGSGCGGVVHILLERRRTASPPLHALKAAFDARAALAIATVLDGPWIGHRAFASGSSLPALNVESDARLRSVDLEEIAQRALVGAESLRREVAIDGRPSNVWVDYRAARPGLWIFGAGDDAKPLVNLARELGWFVAVADGRTHLATRARFSRADQVHSLSMGDLMEAAPDELDVHPGDAAVLMTHSFEQDSHILAWMMRRECLPTYVGVLGPQRRTREVLAEAVRLNGVAATLEGLEEWLDRLHAPTGLDLGAETPAAVALSILSEMQKALTAASARPLREVRATPPSILRPA